MNSSKGGRAAILFILVGGLGVGTLAYYVKSTPEAARVPEAIRVPPKPKSPKTSVVAVEEEEKPKRVETRSPQAERVRLPVFGDDISDMELAKGETTVPPGADAMRFVAERIVEAAHFDGTRVLGIDVRDHVVFVQFNDAVGRGMGSMQEGAFLRAFQVGFGQFGNVDKVVLESEGKPLESGHVDLSEPMAVIRPGEKTPADPMPVEP